jgi:peroxiredoxin
MTAVRDSRVGTAAVPFDLVDSRGVRHTLAAYRGRWLLLVFHRHLG